MSAFRRWARYFRPDARQDVRDEIAFHLAHKRDELIAAGVPPAEAEARARREFGDIGEYQALCVQIEQARIRRMEWRESMLTWWQDARFAARRLRTAPMFTSAALLTLALGLGANAAIFAVIYGVLFKPLPYRDPEKLVVMSHPLLGMSGQRLNASPATYFTYRDEARTLEAVGLWRSRDVAVAGDGAPERVPAIVMTEDVLRALKAPPALGRGFESEDMDPKGPRRVILSHRYCEQRFGAGRDVLGRTLNVDGAPHEIVGVMPPSFQFLDEPASLLLPLRWGRAGTMISDFSFEGIGRLKPGITVAGAQSDLGRALTMLDQKFPLPPGMSPQMFKQARITVSVTPLKQEVVGGAAGLLWIVMAAAGLVLLVACANIANLVLARAEGRQQELAIRSALGAGWTRLARELLVESLMLGAGGGLLALAIAYGCVRWLQWFAPAGLPRLSEIGLHPAVLAFTAALSLLAALVTAAFPIARYAGPRAAQGLRARQSRESYRTRFALATAQVALAVVLLTGCGLMLRTARALDQVDPGFTAPEQVLTLTLRLPDTLVKDDKRVARVWNEIHNKVAALPGVEAVGFISHLPMSGNRQTDPLFVKSQPEADGRITSRRYQSLAPGYLAAMGIPLVAGRDVTWDDTHRMRHVVLVNESLAKLYWGDARSALGQEVREIGNGLWRQVVGVVADTRDDGLHRPAPPTVYWTILRDQFFNNPTVSMRALSLAVRSPRAGEGTFLDEIRRAVWSVNPDLPVADPRTMRSLMRRSMARTSFALTLLLMAGALALVLGVVGIYGVMAHAVVRRTREVGIRLTLGSPAPAVVALFVRQGLAMAVAGVIVGLAAAWPLARFLESLLFGVRPLDPVTYGAVALGLAVVTLVAAWIPSARAAAVDPARTLRAE